MWRARILGDSLLYAQTHDPNPSYTDGRLRDSYFVAPSFVTSGGPVQLDGAPAYLNGTAVGNVAWAGLALARLYAYTGGQSYLDGALKLGAWIVNNAYDAGGYGGYKFGVNADNSPSANGKSTEHNIDTYAFFVELAQLTGDQTYAGLTQPQPWSVLAGHALDFVHAMWEPTVGHFWTGTNPDGSINKYPIPEDVQTWSYLALEDPAYAASVDWASARLAVTDTPEARNATLTGNVNFSGVTFSNGSMQADPTVAPNGYTPKPDLSAVWFEGTAHIADALLFRDTRDSSATVLGDDRALAAFYLSNIQRAQALLGQNQTVGGKALAPGYRVCEKSWERGRDVSVDFLTDRVRWRTERAVVAARNPWRGERR